MASIARDKNGSRRILFVHPDGRRPTIRLGKVSKRTAEGIKNRVKQLLEALHFNQPMDGELAQWVANLEPPLARRLAAVGLIAKRATAEVATLGPFLESYIERRVDVSPHTRRIWRQTARLLVSRFGSDRALGDVTRGDAADWRLDLVAAGLADASVRKHCGFAKHFFARAVEHELIASNPFAKLVSSPVGNASRQYFVTRDDTAKVLDACPDAQWRLIVALSRYGGLRCPSEHLALSWGDVDWERSRLVVRSPKTARHAGHESRVVPLFPELRPFLEAVFDSAEPGTENVITRFRDDANVRTQLTRIVVRAGLTPWPRITHNLRASRATELAAEYPAHVAAAWLGHSTLVAHKHYWQVTDADFERAAKTSEQGGAESGALSAQNAAQWERAAKSTESYASSLTDVGDSLCAASGGTTRDSAIKMAEVHGNRTTTENAGETADSNRGGAESGALGAQHTLPEAPPGPELAAVVEAWPNLPEAIKAGIVAMIRAAK